MTSKERDILDQLRTDVHGYHLEVQSAISQLNGCAQDVHQVKTDIYGNPNDREGNPGLMTQVADLRKSRRIMLGVVTGAWTVATILLGALASRWF